MAGTVAFELVSPERLLVSAPVEMVVVPGAEGDFGVLPGHAPMISAVRTGVISIWNGGAVERRIFVAGGFAEVEPDRCTVLAEDAVALEDAAPQDAEDRLREARQALEEAADEAARAAAEKRVRIAEALDEAIRERRPG